jgi:SAM-dependent methyltransferase
MTDISTAPSPTALRTVRSLLKDEGFDIPGICARLEIPSIYEFQPISFGRPDPGAPSDPLDCLILLFMDGLAADEQIIVRHLTEPALSALFELGLLDRLDDGRCHATVSLYPTRSLYLISDSPTDPRTGETRTLPGDAVYPAVTEAARHFVRSLPPDPAGRFLELCSGTGVGALAAARTADHAWAVDITERSTRFAAFNAALNGLENVTALRGDLYEPVEGLEFDTIVAHPPYMPSDEVSQIYRDGGEDGEQITRGILRGLRRHLAPGGRFHCTCMLTDRSGVDLEDRIREMIGPDAEDFDLLFMPMSFVDSRKSLFDEALRGRATLDETRRREALFQRLGVQNLAYCSFTLRRKMEGRPPLTLRRPRSSTTDGAAIAWLLDWEVDSRTRLAPEELAGLTPAPSPHVWAKSKLALRDGFWHTVDISLETSWPFPSSVRCAPWLAELVARCDGLRPVSEHLTALKEEGLLAPDAPESGLLEMVRSLVSAGMLVVEAHAPPTKPQD